jgi:hypothetical protein
MDLYRKIGIDPPRGVLLYGPPGNLLCFVGNVQAYVRYGKDDACQGCCQLYYRFFHPCCWFRICAKIPRRGELQRERSGTKLTVRVPVWSEMCFGWQERTRHVSSSSMKSMLSLRNDSMHKLGQIERYNVSCSSCSIKWTVSISKRQLR